VDQASHGTLHHVEVWVPNLDRATASWGWLLTQLGYEIFQDWPGGKSWRSGPTYIVFEQSPARTATRHDRCRPGLNHLAFHVESRARADALAAAAAGHGWRLMFADQHPYAGGKGHYAAYLENIDGYEAELVAPGDPPPAPVSQAPSASASQALPAPVSQTPAAPVSQAPPASAPSASAPSASPPAGTRAAPVGGGAPPAAGTPPASGPPPASRATPTSGAPPAAGAPPAS
jgi:catechol 2,3-dioxygenase-like lactoylglutathione lyase family enzyme